MPTWTPADFAFLTETPGEVDLESNFGRLLYRTCEAIHGLNLFKAVLPFLRPQLQWNCPVCVVAPDTDGEEPATNCGWDVRYRFRIGFVVGGMDGGLLALQCLALRQAVKRYFRGTATKKLIFADVVGHSDTNVVLSMPSPMQELEGGALEYNTGLTIEYLVREMRGQT